MAMFEKKVREQQEMLVVVVVVVVVRYVQHNLKDE